MFTRRITTRSGTGSDRHRTSLALLAVTALAVDGGNVFAQRRKAQSTADDAALAGGLAKIGGQDISAAVLSVTRACRE